MWIISILILSMIKEKEIMIMKRKKRNVLSLAICRVKDAWEGERC